MAKKTKKSAGRRPRSRGSSRPPKGRIAAKTREILGASSRAPLESLVLEDATRAQLLEIGRLLGVRGTSRLPKADLAERVRLALVAESSPRAAKPRAASGKSRATEKRAKPSKRKPKPKPKPKPTAPIVAPSPEHGWSRAEFQARKFSLDDAVTVGQTSPSGAPSPPPETIPWGYGRTRVGALPVDPERVFVYWEVTDEAVGEARSALGPTGASAWLNLRVYDTTGRLFDGTNARSYFDQGVGNGSRQWFFDIGRPGSEAFVELGLRSADGGFRKIARSGRVAFPRRAPAAYREPQWLTVRASSDEPVVAMPATPPTRDPDGAKTPPHELPGPPGPAPAQTGHALEEVGPSTDVVQRTLELSEERRNERTWRGPVSTTSWESEPFSTPFDVPEPVRESYPGEMRTFQVDGRTHVVFGPWQVVVRGIGAYGGRRVLSRWVVYRSWAVEGKEELRSAGAWGRMMGSSARLGGSERRFGAASELRLSGSSELYYRGASERRFGGASERVYAAASERLMRGASERRFRGASERRLGGASEPRLGGASGRWPTWTRIATPDE